jgi:hypothetical protein
MEASKKNVTGRMTETALSRVATRLVSDSYDSFSRVTPRKKIVRLELPASDANTLFNVEASVLYSLSKKKRDGFRTMPFT